MSSAPLRTILLAGVVFVSACESLYLFSESNVTRVRQELLEEHRMLAKSREGAGDLRAALEEWRVVEALAPESEEPRKRIRALQRRIDARVAFHVRAAPDALRRGMPGDARMHLLKALALKPGEKSAADLLRGIERTGVAAELAKVSTEPQVASATTDVAYSSPSDRQKYRKGHDHSGHEHWYEGAALSGGRTLHVEKRQLSEASRSVHLRLAATYRAQNKLEKALDHLMKARDEGQAGNGEVDQHIAETKAALAEQFYKQGVKSFRLNLDEAIKAFERALDFEPEHERARYYLSTAVRLRQQRNVSRSGPQPQSAQ